MQINQLKEIILELCNILVQNEQEKSNILKQMNTICIINTEKEQHNEASNIVAQSPREKIAAESTRKEKEKRKERKSKRVTPYQFIREDRISSKIDFFNKWAGRGNKILELVTAKRFHHDNK